MAISGQLLLERYQCQLRQVSFLQDPSAIDELKGLLSQDRIISPREHLDVLRRINFNFKALIEEAQRTMLKAQENLAHTESVEEDCFQEIIEALADLRNNLYPNNAENLPRRLTVADVKDIEKNMQRIFALQFVDHPFQYRSLMGYGCYACQVIPAALQASQEAVENYFGKSIEDIRKEEEYTPPPPYEYTKMHTSLNNLICPLEQLSESYKSIESLQPKRRKIALWVGLGILVAIASVLTCGIVGVIAGGVFGGFLAMGSVFPVLLGPTFTPLVTFAIGFIGVVMGGGTLVAGLLYGAYNGIKKLARCRKKKRTGVTVPEVVTVMSGLLVEMLEGADALPTTPSQGAYLMASVGGGTKREDPTPGVAAEIKLSHIATTVDDVFSEPNGVKDDPSHLTSTISI